MATRESVGANLPKDAPVFIPPVEAPEGGTEGGEIERPAKLSPERILYFPLWEHVCAGDNHSADDWVCRGLPITT